MTVTPLKKVIQLHGNAVLPGFIDAHTHIEGIAEYHRMLDPQIPLLKDVDEMLRKIKERDVCGRFPAHRSACTQPILG